MSHQTILFATDFSGRDEAAFKTACRLATRSNAKLLVLHVQDPRYSAQSKATRKDPNVEFVRYIPADYGVNFDQILKVGDPDDKILETVDSENVSLIILGTHGRSGIGRAFAGSVAENVLRNADIPVMTVRNSGVGSNKHKRPRILVPVDFSVYGYAALDYATKLALSIGAEISVVHVDDEDVSTAQPLTGGQSKLSDHRQNTWKQLRRYAPQSERVLVTHKLLRGDAATAIVGYADAHKYDFIVLGTHGRSGLSRAIIGSVAESVVRRANCPVISIKPSNKRTEVLQ